MVSATSSRVHYVGYALLIVLCLEGVAACKKIDISLQDRAAPEDDQARALRIQQNQLLNDSSLAVAISGTYQAVSILWERNGNPYYYTEGSLTFDKPDPRLIASTYHLQVEPTAKKDSIQLIFWGSGYGGTVAKRNLGRFKLFLTNYRNKLGDTATGYTLDSWLFSERADIYQIGIERRAYAAKTEISYSMALCEVLDKSRADYGQIAIDISGQSDPNLTPYNLLKWGHFIFTRRSTGTLSTR